MDASGPEPEQLERDYPGVVVWTTVKRLWYARPLKHPDVTLSADSGDGLRQEIEAWTASRGNP
jgi:hypothetical protein